jgi:hypothetical protein
MSFSQKDLSKIEPPTTSDGGLWDIWMTQHHLATVTVSIEIGLFELLHKEKSLTIEQIIEKLGLDSRAAEAVLGVLAGLKLVTKHLNKFFLTDAARTYLVPESVFYWKAMLVNGRMNDFHTRLLGVIKLKAPMESAPIKEWEMGELTEDRARRLTNAMQAHSFAAAIGASRNYDWSKTKKFLDVAGGSGCFAIALAQQHKLEKITVAELPVVCKITHEYITKFQVEGKVDTHPLNMFTEEWPQGYDAHFFSNIFHDWSWSTCQLLAKKSFGALPSGGRIHLHEILLRDSKDGDLTAACFSMHMLLNTNGKQFSAEDLQRMLTEIGFTNIDITPSYAYYSIVTGTKP